MEVGTSQLCSAMNAANHRFQPTYFPPLRYGKSAAEAGR